MAETYIVRRKGGLPNVTPEEQEARDLEAFKLKAEEAKTNPGAVKDLVVSQREFLRKYKKNPSWVESPRAASPAPEPDQGRFLESGTFRGFSSKDSPSPSMADWLSPVATATRMAAGTDFNSQAAGVAMAGLEMVKALAQRSPIFKDKAADVVRWVDEEKSKYWRSGEQGGFFESPWAEAGRQAANLVASGYAGAKVAGGLGSVPGEVGKRLNTFTGTVGVKAPAAGAAVSALQEVPEGGSGLDQALWSALISSGVALVPGALQAGSDVVKKLVASVGDVKLRSILNPLWGQRASDPIAKLGTPGSQEGRRIESLGGPRGLFTAGQTTSRGEAPVDFTLISRERQAMMQPGGTGMWQDLARRQAEASEGIVSKAVGAVTEPASAGAALQRSAGSILDDLVTGRKTNWVSEMAQTGNVTSRDINILPYMQRLQQLAQEHGSPLAPAEVQAIGRNLVQRLNASIRAGGRGTPKELEQLLASETQAAFGGGGRVADLQTAADRWVRGLVKDSLEDTLRINARAGHKPSQALLNARTQFAQDSQAIDEFTRTLKPALSEARSPEQALRAILDSKSPSIARGALTWLDQYDPVMASTLRHQYALTLGERGRIPTDPVTGLRFSPSAFAEGQPTGRGAANPEEWAFKTFLTPDKQKQFFDAYDFARRAALHEINPKQNLTAELQTARGGAQAAAGSAAIGPTSSAPYVLRAVTQGEVPFLWRKYLVTPEGQAELSRMTDWQRSLLPAIGAAQAGLIGQSAKPGEPTEGALPSDMDTPMYRIRRP